MANAGDFSLADHYLSDVRARFAELRTLAEKAIAQIGDDPFFAVLDQEANSIALVMKHVAGNLRSRWQDVLTADGDKPDRRRDDEFERGAADSRPSIEAAWRAGWGVLEQSLASLGASDLSRTVTIRGQPHTLVQAINRGLVHTANHVGQIILLAKHWAGPAWTTLSIPRGRSEELTARLRGAGERPVPSTVEP